jgi:hypothetical protein
VLEAEAITTDVKIRMIEAVLKAVTTLTLEQHFESHDFDKPRATFRFEQCSKRMSFFA